MSVLSNFHYQMTGQENGPKLVFLHGVMGFASNFRRIAKAFENEYQVLTYDQRGHGRSFHPAIGYAPDDYANDLLNIIDELGWEKIRLVGHSMGGRAAYHFAAKYPERLTQLVIEDIGPAMYPTGAGFVTKLLDATPVPFPSKRAAKEWFDRDFIEIFKGERKVESLAGYLYANITENDAKEGVWRFYEPGIRESVAAGRAAERWDEIEAIRTPTLLIRGEFSQDLPRAVYDRMLTVSPRIEGIQFADSGHWVHSDHPDQFIEVLRAFFDKKAGTR